MPHVSVACPSAGRKTCRETTSIMFKVERPAMIAHR